MLKTTFWKIINSLHKFIASPRMVLSYKRPDGIILKQTRISNTSVINCPKNLFIEDNVFISHFVMLECSNKLYIGEGCQICSHVLITTHSSHNSIRLYGKEYIAHNGKHLGYLASEIKIGNYTFIGPHVTIMPATTIGKGSIICAYSYVRAGTYPDFAILKGNPATVVGDTRDNDQQLITKYPELACYYNEWAQNCETTNSEAINCEVNQHE